MYFFFLLYINECIFFRRCHRAGQLHAEFRQLDTMLRNHEDNAIHDSRVIDTDNHNRKQLYVDYILFKMRNNRENNYNVEIEMQLCPRIKNVIFLHRRHVVKIYIIVIKI